MWTFQQSTGHFTDPTGRIIANGYSGHAAGVDNPEDEFVPNVGPLPTGTYTIGAPHTPIDILGPVAMPLTPDPKNVMHGRYGFFIHGDTAAMNHTASDGCIILDRLTRDKINASMDKTLDVVT